MPNIGWGVNILLGNQVIARLGSISCKSFAGYIGFSKHQGPKDLD